MPDTDKLYNRSKMDDAITAFENSGLESHEAVMAAAEAFTKALQRFKTDAKAFRSRVGEDRIRDFAMEELNDTIYEIQDSIPVAVRIFNSFMRDPDGKE